MLIIKILIGSYLVVAFYVSLSMLLLNYSTLKKMNHLKLVILFISSPVLVVKNLIKEKK